MYDEEPRYKSISEPITIFGGIEHTTFWIVSAFPLLLLFMGVLTMHLIIAGIGIAIVIPTLGVVRHYSAGNPYYFHDWLRHVQQKYVFLPMPGLRSKDRYL